MIVKVTRHNGRELWDRERRRGVDGILGCAKVYLFAILNTKVVEREWKGWTPQTARDQFRFSFGFDVEQYVKLVTIVGKGDYFVGAARVEKFGPGTLTIVMREMPQRHWPRLVARLEGCESPADVERVVSEIKAEASEAGRRLRDEKREQVASSQQESQAAEAVAAEVVASEVVAAEAVTEMDEPVEVDARKVEALEAENARLRRKNAFLGKKIVALQAVIQTQSDHIDFLEGRKTPQAV